MSTRELSWWTNTDANVIMPPCTYRGEEKVLVVDERLRLYGRRRFIIEGRKRNVGWCGGWVRPRRRTTAPQEKLRGEGKWGVRRRGLAIQQGYDRSAFALDLVGIETHTDA